MLAQKIFGRLYFAGEFYRNTNTFPYSSYLYIKKIDLVSIERIFHLIVDVPLNLIELLVIAKSVCSIF